MYIYSESKALRFENLSYRRQLLYPFENLSFSSFTQTPAIIHFLSCIVFHLVSLLDCSVEQHVESLGEFKVTVKG